MKMIRKIGPMQKITSPKSYKAFIYPFDSDDTNASIFSREFTSVTQTKNSLSRPA